MLTLHQVPPVPEPRVQSEGFEDDQEEGESMDAVNQDDEGMMAMMGIAGFGSTKVRILTMGACWHLKILHRGSTLTGTKRVLQRLRRSGRGDST